MAKVVSFKAKNVFGKDFNIVDTYDNVKKLNQGLIAMLKAIDELESKKKDNVTLMDYQEVISEEVVKYGGVVEDSLTKKTSFLIVPTGFGDQHSAASDKARKYGVPIVEIDQVPKYLEDHYK